MRSFPSPAQTYTLHTITIVIVVAHLPLSNTHYITMSYKVVRLSRLDKKKQGNLPERRSSELDK